MIWPLAFEFDYKLRKLFESACEAQEIYGLSRENWQPADIDIPTANFVWNEAKRLLN